MSDTPAVDGYMTIERGWVPIDDLTREEAIEAVKGLGAEMHRNYAEHRRRQELHVRFEADTESVTERVISQMALNYKKSLESMRIHYDQEFRRMEKAYAHATAKDQTAPKKRNELILWIFAFQFIAWLALLWAMFHP